MAGTGRTLQQLCRAAFSLCNAASTSAAGSPALAASAAQLAGGSLRSAAAAGGFGQQHAFAAGGLQQLVRHFHSALDLRQAAAAAAGDAPAAPTMNPLQQAPTPAAGKGRAAAGASPLSGPAAADFGLGVGGFGGPGAGEEAGNISRAVTRGLSISPQKLNDFAKVVRGLHIQDALIQCSISVKKSAKVVQNTLLSAKANAVTNQGLDPDRLRVAEAWVGKGSHLKRISMHGRGRSGQRLRYRSHLTIVLREEATEPKRRTRIVPMLMERQKLWDMREAAGVGEKQQRQR